MCNCIEEMDNALKEQNLALNCVAFSRDSKDRMITVITLATDWIDKSKAPRGKKNRTPHMIAAYCPFCGGKLNKAKTEEVTS